MKVTAIVAAAENGTIGREGDLPWHLPDDMKFFQRTTRGHHVITGRKNYESIPVRFRPLKDRVNVVVTRDRDYQAPGAVVVNSLEEALEHAGSQHETEAFIIGGGQIYREAIAKGLVHTVLLTRVHAQVEGDTRFPELPPAAWKEVWREEHPADDRHAHAFSFVRLERIEPSA